MLTHFVRTPAAAALLGLTPGIFRRQIAPTLPRYGTCYPLFALRDLEAIRGRPITAKELEGLPADRREHRQ